MQLYIMVRGHDLRNVMYVTRGVEEAGQLTTGLICVLPWMVRGMKYAPQVLVLLCLLGWLNSQHRVRGLQFSCMYVTQTAFGTLVYTLVYIITITSYQY